MLKQTIDKFDVSSIRIKEYGVRTLIHQQDTGRKSVRSQRDWTDEEAFIVVNRVREADSWFTSIKFTLHDNLNREVGKITINRHSEITVYSNYPLASRIIENAASANSKVASFYRNRGFEDNPESRVEPIVIEFKESIFEDKLQNQRLIEVLDKFPRSASSVLHGNPYLRASIVSYIDGSSFSVWVLSQNRILIRPKTRSTAATLGALCNHICDEFQEGEMSYYLQDSF